MKSFSTFAFTSGKIISWGESVFDSFVESITQDDFRLETGDVVVITSKVVSMEQQDAVELNSIIPTDDASELALETKMDPKLVQLVIDESDQIYGGVFHAILAKSRFGLTANAGIDLSNAPDGFALLLPRDPDSYARSFRQKIYEKYGIKVGVLITDSRTLPLKRGTTGVTLGVAGIPPIIDDRGKLDLYGYTMSITTQAVADNIATAANLLMGETNERSPFAVIRGLNMEMVDDDTLTMDSTMMPEDQCLYFAPFIKLIGDKL